MKISSKVTAITTVDTEYPYSPAQVEVIPAVVSLKEVGHLLSAFFGGEKIRSIKAIRDLTGAGLQESKELYEKFVPANHNVQVVKTHVTPFPGEFQN